MPDISGEIDQSWADRLSHADEAERETLMRLRYIALAGLPTDVREEKLRSMLLAEYSFPDATLREITKSRLRTLLNLDRQVALTVAASLDAVMASLPGAIAWRRVALVQTMSRDFTAEENLRLREFVPGIFGEPVATTMRTSTSSVSSEVARKPWWAFWRHESAAR